MRSRDAALRSRSLAISSLVLSPARRGLVDCLHTGQLRLYGYIIHFPECKTHNSSSSSLLGRVFPYHLLTHGVEPATGTSSLVA